MAAQLSPSLPSRREAWDVSRISPHRVWVVQRGLSSSAWGNSPVEDESTKAAFLPGLPLYTKCHLKTKWPASWNFNTRICSLSLVQGSPVPRPPTTSGQRPDRNQATHESSRSSACGRRPPPQPNPTPAQSPRWGKLTWAPPLCVAPTPPPAPVCQETSGAQKDKDCCSSWRF